MTVVAIASIYNTCSTKTCTFTCMIMWVVDVLVMYCT